MGLVVVVLAVAAALASTAVANSIRRVLPYVSRIGGALLLITGAYAGYGYYELQLFHGDGDPSDPIVDAAGEIQSTLVGWLDKIGPVPLLITLTVLVGGGIVLTPPHPSQVIPHRHM